MCALTSNSIPTPPFTFHQDVKIDAWRDAMGEEFQALQANGTWSLYPRSSNLNVIRNKWVYKVKQMADGLVERLKARLVVKSFKLLDGLDYYETFSPVIKSSTIELF